MIKRLFIITVLLALAAVLAGCGGGGSGASVEPNGVDPSLPSRVILMPVSQMSQTNATIDLVTKVLDGNGNPVPNIEVIYTNLTTLGVLSATTARTNSIGQAMVTIFSTDVGVTTIQAEVSVGTKRVRDRKWIYYSPFELFFRGAAPTLTLDVDSNANGIFDEPADYILLHGANNDQSVIRATVKDSGGSLVAGDSVTFTADSTEASFPLAATKTTPPSITATTGANGEAEVLMQVSPTILRNVTTILTVSAISATTKAANIVSFFLDPVTVGSVTLTANPTTVASAGTSEITATVTTSGGTLVPDGTTVNFTATKGAVEPFAQTTGGQAKVKWTAPTVTANTSATITGSAAGKSGSVSINITAPAVPLQVIPATRSVNSATTAQAVTFTISGGTGPYIVDSSNPALVSVPGTSTGSLTATIAANACPGAVTITITDSTGASVTATVNITATPLTVTPLAGSCPGAAAVANCFNVAISGGVLPYLPPVSGNTSLVTTTPISAAAPYTFTVQRGTGALTTPGTSQTVNITVSDSCAKTQQVVVTVGP